MSFPAGRLGMGSFGPITELGLVMSACAASMGRMVALKLKEGARMIFGG